MKFLVPMLLLAVVPATADLMTFSRNNLLARFVGTDLIGLDSIGAWNGLPISDTNRPSDYERTLSATINFYADPTAENRLFLQVTDVVSTRFGFVVGPASANSALTGIHLDIKPKGQSLGAAVLSTDYANPGQRLLGPNQGVTAIDTTPGWQLEFDSRNRYTLKTPGFRDFGGFGESGWVQGSQRVAGGGVFLLSFNRDVDASKINWQHTDLSLGWGVDDQWVLADYLKSDSDGRPGREGPTAVPDPGGTLSLLSGAVLCLWLATRTGRRVSAES